MGTFRSHYGDKYTYEYIKYEFENDEDTLWGLWGP